MYFQKEDIKIIRHDTGHEKPTYADSIYRTSPKPIESSTKLILEHSQRETETLDINTLDQKYNVNFG